MRVRGVQSSLRNAVYTVLAETQELWGRKKGYQREQSFIRTFGYLADWLNGSNDPNVPAAGVRRRS